MDPQRLHLIPHSYCAAAPAPASRRRLLPSLPPSVPRLLPSLPFLPPMLPLLPRSRRDLPSPRLANPLESPIRPRLLQIQNRKTAKTAMFTNPVNIIVPCAPYVSVSVRYIPFPVDA